MYKQYMYKKFHWVLFGTIKYIEGNVVWRSKYECSFVKI